MRYAAVLSVMTLAFGLATSSLAEAEVRLIQGVPLTPMQSSNGDLSLALPAGWRIAGSPQGDSFTITPAGKMQPSVTLAIISVSDLRYTAGITSCANKFHPLGDMLRDCVIPAVRMQLQDSSFPWTPQQAAQAIVQKLQQAGKISFGPPQFAEESMSRAYYKVSSTGASGPLEHWGSIAVFHLTNQILGRREITSLALIAGCSAPSGETQSFYHTCAGIVHSIRLAPDWAIRFATALVNSYVQETQILLAMGQTVVHDFAYRSQMIAAAGQAVQQMQTEMFYRRQAQMVHDADQWSASLRGEDIVRDPQTGKLFSVPHGYQQYCLDDNALNPTIIASNGLDVKPGTWAGNHRCARIMSLEK